MERVMIPGVNGILVNYVEDIDQEGNLYLKPLISVLCANHELTDKLDIAARELLRDVRTIPLP